MKQTLRDELLGLELTLFELLRIPRERLMERAASRVIKTSGLILLFSAGRLLGQSAEGDAKNLLRDIDASQGACSKATPVRAADRKLSGVMLEINYDPDRRTLAAYQDSTGILAEYVEVLTSPAGRDVVLHTIAARLTSDGQVRGLALTTVLSLSAPKDSGLRAKPRTSRPLSTAEQQRVRSISQKVLQRCTNAS
jgi:hypothetical protein